MLIGEKDDLLERMHAEEQDPEEIGRVYEERKALIDEREMIKRKAEELRQVSWFEACLVLRLIWKSVSCEWVSCLMLLVSIQPDW